MMLSHGPEQPMAMMEGVPGNTPPSITLHKCDGLNIASGERRDLIVNCDNPGAWALHCHVPPHAETDQCRYGMMTAREVQ